MTYKRMFWRGFWVGLFTLFAAEVLMASVTYNIVVALINEGTK